MLFSLCVIKTYISIGIFSFMKIGYYIYFFPYNLLYSAVYPGHPSMSEHFGVTVPYSFKCLHSTQLYECAMVCLDSPYLKIVRLFPVFVITISKPLMNPWKHLSKYLWVIVRSKCMFSFNLGKNCQIVLPKKVSVCISTIYVCMSISNSFTKSIINHCIHGPVC